MKANRNAGIFLWFLIMGSVSAENYEETIDSGESNDNNYDYPRASDPMSVPEKDHEVLADEMDYNTENESTYSGPTEVTSSCAGIMDYSEAEDTTTWDPPTSVPLDNPVFIGDDLLEEKAQPSFPVTSSTMTGSKIGDAAVKIGLDVGVEILRQKLAPKPTDASSILFRLDKADRKAERKDRKRERKHQQKIEKKQEKVNQKAREAIQTTKKPAKIRTTKKPVKIRTTKKPKPVKILTTKKPKPVKLRTTKKPKTQTPPPQKTPTKRGRSKPKRY